MRCKLLYLLLLTFFAFQLQAQNWNKKYVTAGNDFANSIVEINNNLFINITNDASCKLIMTDLSGNLINETQFNNLFRTSTILKSDDQKLIVIGNDINNNGIVVMKLDYNFNEIWSFRSSFASYNFAECAIKNSNGDITICGYTSSDPNATADRNGLIMRINSSGQVVWTRILNFPGTDYFSGICEGNNGEMLLTGAFLGGSGLMDLAVYKINANGDALYLNLYGGGQNDGGYSVDYLNNHYYISGNTWSAGAGDQDMLVMKFTNSMNLVWSKVYGGKRIEPGLYITHGADDNLLLLGQTTSVNGKSRDICLLQLNENGDILKMKNLGGVGDEAIAFGYKVILLLDNQYYIVCGSKTNSVDYDALLMHTDLITNDDCCRTVEGLSFISTDANLAFSSISFNTNNNTNRNNFNIQKSVVNFTIDYLCIPNYTIDLALFYDNTKTCQNVPISFQSMSSAPNLNFKWNFGDVNSGLNNTSELENPTHLFSSAGTYLVTLIGGDNCVNDTDTVKIVIKESVSLNTEIQRMQSTFCVGKNVSFNALTSDLDAVHLWDFDDENSGSENTSTLKNTSHLFSSKGVYSVKLKAFNDCNIDSAIIVINILDDSPPDFNYTIDSCIETIQFINAENDEYNSYKWVYNNLVFSESKHATFQLSTEGEYDFMLIKNPNSSCEDTISKKVMYTKIDNSYLILIPSIFSPNNDGKNDLFTIEGNIKCDLKMMKVFNRWGTTIYSSSTNFSWDGKNDSNNAPEGIYIVYIEYANRKLTKTFCLQR